MSTATFRGPPNGRKDDLLGIDGVRPGIRRRRSTLDTLLANLPSLKRTRGMRKVLMRNHTYMLLAFVPLGITAGVLEWNPTVVFLFNTIAILPLAMLTSFATDELSANTGQTIGALLNATFGNAVEMIVSTVALLNGEIRIVQASMLGAILSNILLGLGCCLFIGGYHRDCQFNATAASAMASLMAVASTSLVIPAALNFAYEDHDTANSLRSILVLSRGTAIILLILYVFYLYFQLKTHSHLFEEGRDSPQTPQTLYPPAKDSAEKDKNSITYAQEDPSQAKELQGEAANEERILSPPAAIALLFAISLTIALCAEFLVSNIASVSLSLGIPSTFIGLILLPLIGNAAEYISAALAASRQKMDLAIGVALGSSLQIALFVTPLLVIVGWAIGVPMSLSFEPFGAVVFFLSVIVVTGLISDGDSNYLEGAMLVGTYTIIAIAFYVYPDKLPHEVINL